LSDIFEPLPRLAPALSGLLFPIWLIYRLIKPAQDASLRGRFQRLRRGSIFLTCVAYVTLFLAASVALMIAANRITTHQREVSIARHRAVYPRISRSGD